jgi:hypothetical protein
MIVQLHGYRLFVRPVILGKGIPLFTGLKDKTKLKLLTTSIVFVE